MKVSILAFDLSDNATGRAELLARLLRPRYEVEVVGPRFGDDVWGPARQPEPTSYGLGLLARARRRRPLVLDVDDWELGFFQRGGFWGRLGRAVNVSNPNGLPWTWLVERLRERADAVTVASRFLERRYGGVLVPHVRDTDAWTPERFDRAAGRALLGLGGERVVMFLGTPRAYKGVRHLVDAVGMLAPGVVLAVVGVDPGSPLGEHLQQPWVRTVAQIAFDDVPRYVVAADVVAVPQLATADTVGQVPAKLFDAMALGRPIVSTAVSMIPEILEGCGVIVAPGDVGALAGALRRLLDDPPEAARLGRLARARCVDRYSFTAARASLFPLFDAVGARGSRR
ncbi:MAG: glycosyltransferase family 4 protein [Candidatus Rokubacteria bacterium]|nr:glycosyltransferase family 4 protein [Candidatus Rokubacteria bacterium]